MTLTVPVHLHEDERKLWAELEKTPKGTLKARSVLLLLSRIYQLRKENARLKKELGRE